MPDWRTELDEAMLRIVSYTSLDNRLPKEYLPGVGLLPREMHLIEAILHHPEVNTTELSRITGIPKGTVSRMTQQLSKRGLLTIYKRGDNLKTVHYQGTSLGQRVVEAHIEFHKVHGREFYEHFDSLNEEHKALVVDILSRYADYMKEYCDDSAPHMKLRAARGEPQENDKENT